MYFPKMKCFLFLPNIHGVSFRFLILSPLIEFLHRPACACILQGSPFILTYPMIATTTCRSAPMTVTMTTMEVRTVQRFGEEAGGLMLALVPH